MLSRKVRKNFSFSAQKSCRKFFAHRLIIEHSAALGGRRRLPFFMRAMNPGVFIFMNPAAPDSPLQIAADKSVKVAQFDCIGLIHAEHYVTILRKRCGYLLAVDYSVGAGQPFECGSNKKSNLAAALFLAERQGFEPWVPVRVQRFSRPSRSTTPASFHFFVRKPPGKLHGGFWSREGWALRDSNPRPSACKADALNQLS